MNDCIETALPRRGVFLTLPLPCGLLEALKTALAEPVTVKSN
jgi:hypothetical protein